MIKQKNNQKVTALGKRRVNLYKLEQRVNTLEKQLNRQLRVNANQVKYNETITLSEEVVLERLRRLEQIVLPEKPALKKPSVFVRALLCLRAWFK